MEAEQSTDTVDLTKDNSELDIISPCTDFDMSMNSSDDCPYAHPWDTIPVLMTPKVFIDNRGAFSESIICSYRNWYGEYGMFIKDILNNTKQVNRNITRPGVCRGFHAQRSPYCQGKFVECISSSTPIWNIIIDARPDSKTFQQYKLFKLSGVKMNKLWVPRGFLNCMIASKYEAVVDTESNDMKLVECKIPSEMQYFVDNDYNVSSEVGVNPSTIIPFIINSYYEEFENGGGTDISIVPLFKTVQDGLLISEKDQSLPSYIEFMSKIEQEFKQDGTVWYKP